MKRYILALSIVLIESVVSDELEIAGSPNPVGSGARAAGMADAFVAIADDATAASWNPAGLVQLERPELSIVGSWRTIFESFEAIGHPEFSETHDWDTLELNHLSVVYPLPALFLGRNNIVASLSYQRKYDLSREFSANLDDYGEPLWFRETVFSQEGGLSAISPAVAVELNKKLSIGVAVNFWRSTFLSSNNWRQTITRNSILLGQSIGQSIGRTEKSEYYRDFTGENYTFGLLWRLNEKWNFGARYDTAFTGTVDYRNTESDLKLTSTRSSAAFGSSRERREMRLPATLAAGVAHRLNDRLTLALDVSRTDWRDYWVKSGSGVRTSLVNGGQVDDLLAPPRFDPTYTVRLGGEYVFLPRPGLEFSELPRLWTLRAGLFFDQEPASGKSNAGVTLFNRGDGEAEDFYGFSLGAGLLANQRINIDAAYQFRFGDGVNKDYIRNVAGFEEDVYQHRFLLSTVIYF